MKKILAFLLILVMIFPFAVSCGANPDDGNDQETTTATLDEEPEALKAVKQTVADKLSFYADRAYQDTLAYFWDTNLNGDGIEGFKYTQWNILWEFAMELLALETYYNTTKDEAVKTLIEKEMNAVYTYKGEEFLLTCSGGNNPADDDAAWSCLCFLIFYRFTKNEKSLRLCHDLIKNSFDCWQDGDTSYGMWYRYGEHNQPNNWSKSIYCAGFILAELEYYQITKGTAKEDLELHERSMALYNWIEKNLRRDGKKIWLGKQTVNDNLYSIELIDNQMNGECYASGYTNYNCMGWAGSDSSLFGNTAMAVINKRLYDMTGDKKYLEKAVSTANALVTTPYNVKGVLMNDRDAWTNCAYMGFFVREVLPLEGIDEELPRLFMTTAISIVKNCYYKVDFGSAVYNLYGADWAGGTKWLTNGELGHPWTLMTVATTTHMLYAADYLMSIGLIQVKESDSSLFKGDDTIRNLNAQ